MDVEKSIDKALDFLKLKKSPVREAILQKQVDLAANLEALKKFEGWKNGFFPLFNDLQKKYHHINLYNKDSNEREEARISLLALDRLIKSVETKISEGNRAYETLQKLNKEK
jgi:hypothetical protein